MGKFKTKDRDDYTHISMLPYGGLYKIPNEQLEEFYEEYNKCIRDGAKFGILERPKDVGPMLVDVDIVRPLNTIIPKELPKCKNLTKLGNVRKPRTRKFKLEKLYTRERVIEYVTAFQKQLLEHTDATNHESYVLEKRPYLDGKGNCKNGFHLHFPSVWMSREHRSYITKLVKDTIDKQEFETLDDSAVRNNWFLYRSRKFEDQEAYILTYSVDVDGRTSPKQSRDVLVRTLSIRNNITGITNKVLEMSLKPCRLEFSPTTLDDSLLTRCMESLDPSRADDYHDWIKIGCILYTIDKENGYQRWNDFSKQSYKYDEDYLYRTWTRFKDYNYTIGTLIFLARQDDENFSIKDTKVYTRRELLKMCKEKGLKAFTKKTVDELCNLLCLPSQEKNVRGGRMRCTPKSVVLTNVETKETHNFKSIYSTAKFLGRNPSCVKLRMGTKETLMSKLDTHEYKIQ